MNPFEYISNKVGRMQGSYRKGIADAFKLSGSHPLASDPSAWSDPLAWGNISKGGKPKTKADFINAFTGWVYTCVSLNATTVASVPLRLYVAKEQKGKAYKLIDTKPVRRQQLQKLYSNASLEAYLVKSEEVEEVTSHRLLQLLKNVNPYHNSRDLFEFTSMFGDLTGEAYWYIIRDGAGVPGEIYSIPSQHISPVFGETLSEAITGYVYKSGDKEVKLDVEDIISFINPSPHNIFTGFSCVRGVADAVYIQSQMNAFETALFENRAKVGWVFSSEDNISKRDQERLTQQFETKYKGAARSGKDLILPKGLKYHSNAMTPEEISFIEGRKINREEICAALDVPFGVFDTHANRATSETADYRHAKNGIKPRLERIEQKINERLIPMYEGEGGNGRLFVAFDECVPADKEYELEERMGDVGSGIITINEARADKGLEPIDEGDVPYVDSSLVPLGQQPTEAQAEGMKELVMAKIKEQLGG